ncbi:hypothetical protein KGF56_001875 [Candida oxycetoniae]|uniref:Protein arginine methyltransferase NDUFAF7 n=1 Tax=Candida oxycetoniae TaxID=497107 RepID=A0AAI9WYR9_9ASCO|nr:uncharacterized protein KGF56_001875 [Candida oxycetoniae]KAI3405334.2 hypothetical protein KGF56_001875 [Candida oxycetoniae]
MLKQPSIRCVLSSRYFPKRRLATNFKASSGKDSKADPSTEAGSTQANSTLPSTQAGSTQANSTLPSTQAGSTQANSTLPSTQAGSTLPPHENGLYFGRFTKSEYEEAARVIKEQIKKLESEIKGDHNLRENLGKLAQFPEKSSGSSTSIDVKSLSDLFRQTIKLTGPISLSAYMRQCLTHPKYGYYTTRDPLDLKTGDFITSPEISSVFGEMIGIWYFNLWQTSRDPKLRDKRIRFIEFGPGKGTLIYDILHTFNKFVQTVSEVKPKIEIVMIEASPVLREEQCKLLCGENASKFKSEEDEFSKCVTTWGNEIIWVDTEKSIPRSDDSVNYIIAHEFFDALPIKSFIKEETGWRELVVEHTPSVQQQDTQLKSDLNDESTPLSPLPNQKRGKENKQWDTEFHLSISPKDTPSTMIPRLNKRYKDLPVGSRIEICSDAELFIMKMAQLVNTQGAALVIDYGPPDDVPDNTLRGIYKHQFVSPFFKPGEVDLSVDVDFGNLKKITSKVCDIYGPIQQGDWLHNIGVGYRIDQLLKKKSHDVEAQNKIYDAYRRLVDYDQMGKIYKFMALMPKGSSKPIGF